MSARPFVALIFQEWHATGHSQPQLNGHAVVVPRLFLFLALRCKSFESPTEQNLLACKRRYTSVHFFGGEGCRGALRKSRIWADSKVRTWLRYSCVCRVLRVYIGATRDTHSTRYAHAQRGHRKHLETVHLYNVDKSNHRDRYR